MVVLHRLHYSAAPKTGDLRLVKRYDVSRTCDTTPTAASQEFFEGVYPWIVRSSWCKVLCSTFAS